MAARIAVLLALMMLVVACGGGRESRSRADRVEPGIDRERAAGQMLADGMAGRTAAIVPSGFKLRRESRSGFSVAFPRAWKALDARDARFPGAAANLERYNPALVGYLRGLADPSSPLRLLAFDPDLHRGFATNANVFEVGLAPADVLREVRRLPSLRGVVRWRRVELPAGAAHRLEFLRSYRWRGRRYRLSTLQFTVARRDRTFVLVFSTPAELKRRYWPVFAASARSLTLPA